MVYNILPHIGTDDLKIGCSQEEIRAIIGQQPVSFRKSPQDTMLIDDFGFVQVAYDESGRCKRLEFFAPAEVCFLGTDIIGTPYDVIEKLFLENDPDLDYTGGAGFSSMKYDIGIYAPFAPDGIVESVCVCSENTYKLFADEYKRLLAQLD